MYKIRIRKRNAIVTLMIALGALLSPYVDV